MIEVFNKVMLTITITAMDLVGVVLGIMGIVFVAAFLNSSIENGLRGLLFAVIFWIALIGIFIVSLRSVKRRRVEREVRLVEAIKAAIEEANRKHEG